MSALARTSLAKSVRDAGWSTFGPWRARTGVLTGGEALVRALAAHAT
ncbi:hypothetical protein ABT255_46100 [Streptomyces mirabilis]